MQELDADEPLRHAMHVDVSVAREHVEARVTAALAAGGRIVDDADAPAGWILADRDGNRVCVAAWLDGAVPTAPADPPEHCNRSASFRLPDVATQFRLRFEAAEKRQQTEAQSAVDTVLAKQ